jgi:hypothetical protein
VELGTSCLPPHLNLRDLVNQESGFATAPISTSAFINRSLEVLEIRFELRVRLVFERGLEPKNKVQPCP